MARNHRAGPDYIYSGARLRLAANVVRPDRPSRAIGGQATGWKGYFSARAWISDVGSVGARASVSEKSLHSRRAQRCGNSTRPLEAFLARGAEYHEKRHSPRQLVLPAWSGIST